MRSKTNVLSAWKWHFSNFCKFLSDKVESFFWESKTFPSKLFKCKVGHGKHFRKSFLRYIDVKNECSEYLKMIFFTFCVSKLKTLSAIARECLQKILNLKLVIRSILENGLQPFLKSKTNFVNVWKQHFNFFKLLSNEVETIIWEIRAKLLKLFKPKVSYRKLFRKWFSIYLQMKSKCSELLKNVFFSVFFKFFEWRSWNRFLGNRRNVLKTFNIMFPLLGEF